MTLSIKGLHVTLSIKGLHVTLSMKGLYVTHSISDTQHNNALPFAECRYAECSCAGLAVKKILSGTNTLAYFVPDESKRFNTSESRFIQFKWLETQTRNGARQNTQHKEFPF